MFLVGQNDFVLSPFLVEDDAVLQLSSLRVPEAYGTRNTRVSFYLRRFQTQSSATPLRAWVPSARVRPPRRSEKHVGIVPRWKATRPIYSEPAEPYLSVSAAVGSRDTSTVSAERKLDWRISMVMVMAGEGSCHTSTKRSGKELRGTLGSAAVLVELKSGLSSRDQIDSKETSLL